jgi:hypothetical protein
MPKYTKTMLVGNESKTTLGQRSKDQEEIVGVVFFPKVLIFMR